MKGEKFRLSDINIDYIKKELLIPDFMEKHSKFSNFDKMIKSSSFKIDNDIKFRNATETMEWNGYIDNNSDFKDWNEMLRTAVLERATRKLII